MAHLDCFSLQFETVERIDGLVCVIGIYVVYKAVSQTLTCRQRARRANRTSETSSQRSAAAVAARRRSRRGGAKRTRYLVPDQLARLDLADAAEQTLELLLGHVLRQVVDDQVGFAVVCGAVGADDGAVGQAGSAWTVGHLGFHGADYLLRERAELDS